MKACPVAPRLRPKARFTVTFTEDLAVTVAIPFSRWGAEPFICAPLPFPADALISPGTRRGAAQDRAEVKPNALSLAETWARELSVNPALTKAKIAKREGLTRARVTQIMGLLKLAPDIQAVLRKRQGFPERAIRHLLQCDDLESQLLSWSEMATRAKWMTE